MPRAHGQLVEGQWLMAWGGCSLRAQNCLGEVHGPTEKSNPACILQKILFSKICKSLSQFFNLKTF